jgi:hypothetical protein
MARTRALSGYYSPCAFPLFCVLIYCTISHLSYVHTAYRAEYTSSVTERLRTCLIEPLSHIAIYKVRNLQIMVLYSCQPLLPQQLHHRSLLPPPPLRPSTHFAPIEQLLSHEYSPTSNLMVLIGLFSP